MEKEIAKIISKYMDVKWIRFNMYVSSDIYRHIPLLVFMLDELYDEKELKRFQNYISEFKGMNEWKLFKDPRGKRGKYILSLKILEETRQECEENKIVYNEKEYFGDSLYKKYCEQAIEDIPLLAYYIEKYFEKNSSKP